MIKRVVSFILITSLLMGCATSFTVYAEEQIVEEYSEAAEETSVEMEDSVVEAEVETQKSEREEVDESTQQKLQLDNLPSGQQGERNMEDVLFTEIDENGDVYEVDMENGYVEDGEISTFSVSEKIVNFNIKQSGKTTNYKEVKTGKDGYTYGPYGADAAYLGMQDGKVKFMLSGVIGLVNKNEVQVIDKSKAKALSHYYVKNGILYHRIIGNLNQANSGSTLNNGKAPSYLKAGIEYYSYDGHYFYTEDDFGDMLEDYNKGERRHSVNPQNPFYNYFQYLPLRSTTAYTISDMKSIINSKVSSASKMHNTAEDFVNSQKVYGVNALLMVSIAANESSWGNSNIAKKKNNLFGLNAVDSSPGESANYFGSVRQCIKEFAEKWMSKEYLNPKNWKYNVGFLGNKASGINVKYASDPYWGEKAAAIAWTLDLANGNKDAKRYTIGIRNTVDPSDFTVNVRNKDSKSSTVLYSSPKIANTAYLLLNNSKTNGFYKIQSDGVLNSKRTTVESSVGIYDFKNMYAYISAEYLTIVNKGSAIPGDVGDQGMKPDGSHPSKNGWVTEGGNKYYYVNGKKCVGEQKIAGKWYCFSSDGKMIVGWHTLPNKKVYYGVEGQMQYGEQKIAGKWYLFDKVTGAMKTGWQTITEKNKKVYYNKSGQMQYGEQKINGKWYLFDKVTGAMKTGWQTITEKNKKVYYNELGQMQYGEQKINGKWYLFDKVTGAMLKNVTYNGHSYDENGMRY